MQQNEMIEAQERSGRALDLKDIAEAFGEAITTGLQRKGTTHEIATDLPRAWAAHRLTASICYE